MTTMDTHSIEGNHSILTYDIDDDKLTDYEYEDHSPDIRQHQVDVKPALKLPAITPTPNSTTTTTTSTFCIADRFTSISSHGKDAGCSSSGGNIDATEVSQSPSQRVKGKWSRHLSDGTAIGAAASTPGFHLDCDNTNNDDEDDVDSYSGSSANIEEDDVIDYEAVIRAAANSVASHRDMQHDDAIMMNDAYPPMPPDRLARKQRSFRRRGGELHGALLKSAVMASMSFDCDDSIDDDDNGKVASEKFPMGRFRDVRRESNHSSISLQSLHDALHSETSPRKRARRGQRRKSFDDDDDYDYDDCHDNAKSGIKTATTSTTSLNDTRQFNDDTMEASDLFVNMRVGGFNGSGSFHKISGNSSSRRTNSGTSMSQFRSSTGSAVSDFSANAAAAVTDIVREAPPRRVSRKTSYDSRVSDYDSDFDSDEWGL